VTNVSRVGPFNASSVWVLPVSDPTYVAYRGRRPAALSGAVRLTRGHGRGGQLGTVDLAVRRPRRLDGGSQLLLRHRYAYGPDWTSRLVFGRFPLEVVSLVMSRKMMLNINRLADRET
jgi:hypothetical protein